MNLQTFTSVPKRIISRLVSDKSPVLVYQMGKVASTSIYRTLANNSLGFPVYQIHRMNPENLRETREKHAARNIPMEKHEERGARLYDELVRTKRRFRVITLVREPISRNISAFFQNLDAMVGKSDAHHLPTEELIESFLTGYPHNVPLTWFEKELLPTTGIDVYSSAFPKEIGFTTFENVNVRVLIMRHNLDDETKSASICQFLKLDELPIRRANVAEQKPYADSSRKFIDSIKLPSSYVDRMLDSKYAKHFWSQAELQAIRQRWTT
ncbi:MAG: putative capsular polysaccharide synthesis family protein [Planctomycetota bacterium]